MRYMEALKEHQADVQRVAATGYYKSQRDAERFFNQHVRPAWIRVLRIDEEDESFEKQYRFTPTMFRMLFLFGRGVNRVAVTKKAPLIHLWPPRHELGRYGDIRFFRGLSHASVAKLIGASHKAVEDGLNRFKGDKDDKNGLFARRLMTVISTDVGVTLDGVFRIASTPLGQTTFRFMYDVELYEQARDYARMQRVRSTDLFLRQTEWSNEGVMAKTGVHAISDDRAPIVDGAEVSA
jgi:hypothetical protein